MKNNISTQAEWARFAEQWQLSEKQCEQFRRYAELLIEWNAVMNLTAIEETSRIRQEHFGDSLILRDYIDFSKINVILDIGTGAGFPAIPLKIAYPHIGAILLEVNQKRQRFLAEVVNVLELADVSVSGLDFRTFVRGTTGEVDLCVARASFEPRELVRLFSPISAYRTALVVYWASAQWQAGAAEAPYIIARHTYTMNGKRRALVFLSATAQHPLVRG